MAKRERHPHTLGHSSDLEGTDLFLSTAAFVVRSA